MEKTLPAFVFFEAPGGYGKTFCLNRLIQARPEKPVVIHYPAMHQSGFYQVLTELCNETGLPAGANPDPAAWQQAWKTYGKNLTLVFDDFHLLEKNQEVLSFLSYFVKTPLQNICFIISSRHQIPLSFHSLIIDGSAAYYDKTELKLTEEAATILCQNEGLSWNKEITEFYNHCAGWPAGFLLFLQFKSGKISPDAFKRLLHSAVSDVLGLTGHNLQNNHPPLNKLKKAFLEPQQWPPLWQEHLSELLLSNPYYWLQQTAKKDLSPELSRPFLQRTLSLAQVAESPEIILHASTRLAHSYSLSGLFSETAKMLDTSEKYLDLGTKTDKIAWLYLQANRLRQLCHHEEALQLLQRIQEINCTSPVSLNLQTRAIVVRGLINYQSGNYTETRKAYTAALHLAEAEKNSSLLLELKIMLAFLDAWEGKTTEALPVDITEQIEQQPLKSQPLMWLNLAFYWLLGDNFDLKTGMQIIEKIKKINETINYDSLVPLIADIEARVWRYSKDFEKAHINHNLALSLLQEGTFEYIHASLNQALTYLREGQSEKAHKSLNDTLSMARTAQARGMEREIITLLAGTTGSHIVINEINQAEGAVIPVTVKASPDKPGLVIKTFGGFGVEINGKEISKWQRKKSKNLLAYLLLHPRGIHRETLADLLFSSETMDNPLQNLDVSIHSLRKVLEPDRKSKTSSFIIFRDSCYSFNWSYPHFLDFSSFEELFNQWLIQHQSEPETVLETAEQLVNLYEGPFLPELDFADDWEEEREQFSRRYATVISWLVFQLLQRNEISRAEQAAEKFRAMDQLSEQPYLLLMQIAAAKKDKNSLKQVYRKLSKTLQKELDLAPSPETEMTYNAIMLDLCK